MLFNLRSIALFSCSIAASPLVCGSVASEPPTPARLPAEPVVMEDGPDELAVPALLVPGGGGDANLAELPAPLESLPELLSPPALAGPDGTPLTPAVPAPAEPALGEPTALPLPAEGPPGGSARACTAAAALSERAAGTNKKRDCNSRRRYG